RGRGNAAHLVPRALAPRGGARALVPGRGDSAQSPGKNQPGRRAPHADEGNVVTSAQGVVDRGRPVEIETERFRLRSLKPAAASERWLSWVSGPEVVLPTNADTYECVVRGRDAYGDNRRDP